jgi:hypothetical protein
MREVIQCLIDWINKDPSDEKPHRILRALAQESLKKADFEECKRRFTADELVAAAEESPKPADPKKWIDWPGSFSNYWQTKEPQIIEFARQQGLQSYPKPERISTKGGPGNMATFCIRAVPLPEIREEDHVFQEYPEKEGRQLQAHYEVASHGAVKPSWLANWLFHDGQIQLKHWHIWLIVGWLFLIGLGTLVFSYVGWFSLSRPQPITTREITLFLTIFGFPYFVWLGLLRPWVRLFEDRVVLAHEIFLNIKEKPAQYELLRDGDLRQIRLVRYSAPCPICGATIYLENGAPDYPRRLVGRCYESPREHVFSFDRVTRRGRLLIGQLA